MIKYIAGCLCVGVILGLGSQVFQCTRAKEELAQLHYVDSIQKESLKQYRESAQHTNKVLQNREAQRGKQDAAHRTATHSLYQAKNNDEEFDIDRPLPDKLVQPLRLQYQAITAANKNQ